MLPVSVSGWWSKTAGRGKPGMEARIGDDMMAMSKWR